MAMKKILVIDDETDICNMLKDYLQMDGYLVYTAGNGTEALSLMNISPDLILLDINMPGMDGYQVCERIREHIHCPIIFLSARVEDADRIKGFRSGGDDYVTKPFSMDELIARIEAHLRREERRTTSSHVYMNGLLYMWRTMVRDFPRADSKTQPLYTGPRAPRRTTTSAWDFIYAQSSAKNTVAHFSI